MGCLQRQVSVGEDAFWRLGRHVLAVPTTCGVCWAVVQAGGSTGAVENGVLTSRREH